MENKVESLRLDIKTKFDQLFSVYDKVRKVVNTSDLNDFNTVRPFFEEKRKPITEALKNQNFYIAFIGPYSTGKSTFLNALFHKDFLPENDEKATTAFPTYIHTVKDSNEEKAIISYYSEKERNELKKFYLEKVNKEIKLNEKIEDLMSLTTEELLDKIANQKEELENSDETYNEKLVKALEKLLSYWEEELDNLKEETTIEESKDFVESNEKSIIIKQIELYVCNNIVSLSDIVLVDLPGVDADNPRHYEVTKRFTMDAGKAHAFVVITSPNKIENDTLNDYLRELSKKARQLERAFWVVNRCDDHNNPENAKLSLKDKIIGNKIDIIEDRLYATSAKLYKMSKEGNAIPSDKQAIVDAVDTLRDALTDYLSNNVFREFYDSQEKEYNLLKKRLLNFLAPRSLHYADISEEELKELTLMEVVDEKLYNWFSFQKKTQHDVIFEIKKELNNFQFFDEERNSSIKNKISEILSQMTDDEVFAATSQFKDINKIEKDEIVKFIRQQIPLNDFIRSEFQQNLESGYLYDILQRPKDLLAEEIENIENPVFKDIDTVLQNTNLKYRLEGLCDAFLIDYAGLTMELIQGTIDDFEGLNSIKANIVLHFIREEGEESLEEELVYKSGKEWINATNEEGLIYFLTKFPNLADLTDITQNWNISDEPIEDSDYLTYIKMYIKYSMFGYLKKITDDVNKLVRVSLNNHFKEVRDNLLLLLESPTVRKQMLNVFRKQVRANSDFLSENKKRDIVLAESYASLAVK